MVRWLVVGSLFAVVACSSGGGGGAALDGGSDAAGATGGLGGVGFDAGAGAGGLAGGGVGGSAGVAGTGAVGGVGGAAGSAGTAGVGGGSGGTTCSVGPFAVSTPKLDWVLLLDRSASMQDTGKWLTTTGQLKSAAASHPASNPLAVALVSFPKKPAVPPPSGTCASGCGEYGPCVTQLNQCTGALSPDDSCVASDYASTDLALSDWPASATALATVLDAAMPDGTSTPMTAALGGAVQVAVAAAQQNPTHRVEVVLLTDGEPTNCTTNTIASVAQVAADALAGTPSIRTRVVTVGQPLAALDGVAQAGGTGQALDGGASGGQVEAILASLASDHACRLPVPANVNPQNLSLVMTSGGTSSLVPVLSGASACAPGGAYLDGGDVVLCPATCSAKTSQGATFAMGEGCS